MPRRRKGAIRLSDPTRVRDETDTDRRKNDDIEQQGKSDHHAHPKPPKPFGADRRVGPPNSVDRWENIPIISITIDAHIFGLTTYHKAKMDSIEFFLKCGTLPYIAVDH
jgi:hypothetical protein